MFCQNCGKEIKEGSKFCPYCGTKLLINSNDKEKKSTVIKEEKNNQKEELQKNEEKTEKKIEVQEKVAKPKEIEKNETQPKKEKHTKKWVIPLVIIISIIVLILIIFGIVSISKKGTKDGFSNQIRNGKIEIKGLSMDFQGNNVANGDVKAKIVKPTQEQENLGIIGDLYCFKLKQSYNQPVKLSIPIPKEFKGEDGEYLKIAVFVDTIMSDGKKEQVHFYLEPQLNGKTATVNFIPSEIMEIPEVMGRGNKPESKVDKSELMFYLGACHGMFFKQDSATGYEGGHFKIALNYKDAQELAEIKILGEEKTNPKYIEKEKKYKKVLDLCEEAYDYYYNKLGYIKPVDNKVFPPES